VRPWVAMLILGPVVVGPAALVLAGASIPLGSLTIRSQPGVEVVWDDLTLGTTDRQGVLEIGEIPPGSYTLLLGKQGFEAQSIPLEVSAGTQALNLSLTAVLEALPEVPELPEVIALALEEPNSPPVALASEAPRAASVWPTALAAAVIVFAGITIFRLARRRPQPARPAPEEAGPKVVMGSPGRRSSRSSTLLRDLKRREDSLENYVESGTGGLKRKVINVAQVEDRPVEDRPVENRPVGDTGGEDR
jgi:hypothetical protein